MRPALFTTSIALLISSALLGACGGDDDGPDGNTDGGGGNTDDEPAELAGITAAHNAVRTPLGLPPLSWDPALAAIARDWAAQCVDNEPPQGLIDHNPGRSDDYPTYVGENIYASSGQASGTDAVASWASEEEDYDYDDNSCAGICGHYTQIVWRETTKLGCAIHNCDGLQFSSTVVCDYGPGGNINGERPY